MKTRRISHKPPVRRFLFLPVLAVLLAVNAAARTEYFVSPSGSDSGPGSKDRPFATLERVRDEVRRLNLAGKLPPKGITVWLRGGDYVRADALELGPADSGRPGRPVVWRAYGNERVRLLGGRVLRGFGSVADPAVLARLDGAARGKVLCLDLKNLRVDVSAGLASRGFSREITPAHCELFCGGLPMTLARWPNEGGFETIAGIPGGSGSDDGHGNILGTLEKGFHYSGERPRRWKDAGDIWVHGYWAYDWADTYEKVAGIDVEKKLVKTAPPYGKYGFRTGQRFYFLNVLEELDRPGEWYLDRASGVLYFWPPESNGAAAKEIVLSMLGRPLLSLDGASDVIFQDLALEAVRGNAVEIRGGSGVRVVGCLIRDIGDYGVVIDGGTGHGVVSCDIEDTGDGGVSMKGGDRLTLVPGGHFVENCRFRRQGRWSKCYAPAVLMTGVGLRVSNCSISDHPHCAIQFTGNDHLIEFNEIHHVAMETGDVGAIYTGRDWTFRGNRVRFNYIHHTGGVGMGSMGVYMDDCVSGTEVYGNVFYMVQRAMFIGGGRDHRVENNVFVDCRPAIQVDGRGLDRSPGWAPMVDETMKKSLGDMPRDLYLRRYPDIAGLDRYYALPETKGVPPENDLIARNVCVGSWLEAGWNCKESMLRLENNSVVGRKELVAPDKGDFRVRKSSPVWKTGFKAIPFERIGLRRDALRAALERMRGPE